jgi:hypothetical protein
MNVKSVLLPILMFSCFFGEGAFSQEVPDDVFDCPARISPDNPRREKTFHGYYGTGGIPLDQLITIQYQGQNYRLPVGYLDPWPSIFFKSEYGHEGHDFEKPWRSSQIKIAFWMPSRRYVERVSPFFRPCENGRPRPAKNEFVVHANLQSPPTHSDWGVTYPRQMLKNLFKLTDNDLKYKKKEFFDRKYELLFYKKNRNNDTDDYFKIDGDVQLKLMCWRTGVYRTIKNPGCSGHLFDIKNGQHFFISFPSYDLEEWKHISGAIIEIFTSWQFRYSSKVEGNGND